MSLLAVEGLSAGYGRGQVLHGVTLEVAVGGVSVVLGANGAGKTTLLRAICGMVAREGRWSSTAVASIGMATEDIARLGVAHVPEGRGTFTNLTTEENLRLGAYRRDAERARGLVRPGLPVLSPSRRASPPAGGHAVGGRAADARDRPRA